MTRLDDVIIELDDVIIEGDVIKDVGETGTD